MVINKKRQPCSGIIQNMITFRKKKGGGDTPRFGRHTYTHTHPSMDSVFLVSEGGCTEILTPRADGRTKSKVNTAGAEHTSASTLLQSKFSGLGQPPPAAQGSSASLRSGVFPGRRLRH